MKILLTTITSFICAISLWSFSSLPNQFTITERFFTLTSVYDFEEGSIFHGKISRQLLSIPLKYDYYDAQGKFVGLARKRILAIGTTFDVTDGDEMPVGQVDKKIIAILPTYYVYDNLGKHVLEVSLNFWGTTFTIKNPKGDEIASVSRPFIVLIKETWTVQVDNPEELAKVDPRLYTLIPVLQTDKDNSDNQAASSAKTQALPAPIMAEKKAVAAQIQNLSRWIEAVQNDLMDLEPTENDFQRVAIRSSSFAEKVKGLNKVAFAYTKELKALEAMTKEIHLLSETPSELKALTILMKEKLREVQLKDAAF